MAGGGGTCYHQYFRWFFKFKEAGRLYELRDTVQEYDDRHQLDESDLCGLVDEDWRLIRAYLDIVKPFEKASKLLGGDQYPAAGMVVRMLDELIHDLMNLSELKKSEELREIRRSGGRGQPVTWSEEGEGTKLVKRMITQFHVRFPRQFKTRSPFNALCLLDPRNMDMYFNKEEVSEASRVIKEDKVFDKQKEADEKETEVDSQNNQAKQPEVTDRRAQLLAAKKARIEVVSQDNCETKIDREVTNYLQKPPSDSMDPLAWWKTHETEFPLLALYMKANGAFQPTSLASERLFNKDKQLFGVTRQSLTEEHGEGFIFLHDFLNKRMVTEQYQLCVKCPRPPKVGASYRKTCSEHN